MAPYILNREDTTKADLFGNLPELLREYIRWVLWRKEPRFAGEKPTKMPFDPKTFRRAKSDDSTTWASYAVALAAFRANRQRFNGLGIMLEPPMVGVDLDACRDPHTGLIVPRAMAIIERLNTYAEVSQSLCGAKLIGLGKMPTPDGRGKNYRKNPWGTGNGGIEMYGHARLWALTGNHLPGTPTTIEPCGDALARLYKELYPVVKATTTRRAIHPADGAAFRRASHYIDKLPSSVSGQGGHDRLLHASCVLVRFGLADGDALHLLHRFNQRACPPWDDRELNRKLSEAHKLIGGGK